MSILDSLDAQFQSTPEETIEGKENLKERTERKDDVCRESVERETTNTQTTPAPHTKKTGTTKSRKETTTPTPIDTDSNCPVTPGWLRHVRKAGYDLVKIGSVPPTPPPRAQTTTETKTTQTAPNHEETKLQGEVVGSDSSRPATGQHASAQPEPYTRPEVLRDLETALRQDRDLAPADRLKYLDRVAQLRGFDHPELDAGRVDPCTLADHLRQVYPSKDPQQVVFPCPLCGCKSQENTK